MKKWLVFLLVLVLAFSMAASATTQPPSVLEKSGYAFDGVFNAFFAVHPDDQELLAHTTGMLLTTTPEGDIVTDGVQGFAVSYMGTQTTHYGIGSVQMIENEDGGMDYHITMREDILFSDGHPADIDDVIFSIYVLCDPAYDGPNAFRLQPVIGMQEYCGTQRVLSDLMIEAGRENTDFALWDEATQASFWEALDAAGAALAQETVDYILENYLDEGSAATIGKTVKEIEADPQLQLQLAMSLWGYGDFYREDMTVADYWQLMIDTYDGDILLAAETEAVNSSIYDLIEGYDEKYGGTVSLGEPVDHIEGVIRTGDYSMIIRMAEPSDYALLALADLPIMPLHYYGDAQAYDWENHRFGFEKGDLSLMHARDAEPLGCGKYIFAGYADAVATLEANPHYFEDTPVEYHRIQMIEG